MGWGPGICIIHELHSEGELQTQAPRGTHLRLRSARMPVFGRLHDGPEGIHVLIPRAWVRSPHRAKGPYRWDSVTHTEVGH